MWRNLAVGVGVLLSLLAVGAATSAPPHDACGHVAIEVFGGRLPVPDGYRLLPEFEDEIRLVRVDRDPQKPHGNIYVGRVARLSSKTSREASASQLGATIERQTRGNLYIEITRRTTRQLLADKPVTYVSALLYDDQHYVKVTDSNPDLWKQMLDECAQCGIR